MAPHDCLFAHLRASQRRLVLIGGKPLNEPVARYGPFVMNTQEELTECFQDYRNGRMGHIDGAEARARATKKAIEAQKKSGTWQKDSSEL